MVDRPVPSERRLRRLTEELADVGLDLDGSEAWHRVAAVELDYALRPSIHERRIPTFGALIHPGTAPETWHQGTQLDIELWPVDAAQAEVTRRYADGRASWFVRGRDHSDALAVFDRPAGSERDLVVLAETMEAVVVQRHATGPVRIVGDFGVYRWDSLRWHHEPTLGAWISELCSAGPGQAHTVIETLLEFAVHDLGARGIGATLVHRPDESQTSSFDVRVAPPPPLRITHQADLAPLRHVLAQVDGAALFTSDGTLLRIGVRLVPSPDAEAKVDGLRGTRHTSGRRFSFDHPDATVIVVSEDGPVTVLRGGEILGTTATLPALTPGAAATITEPLAETEA